jgi:hypothetical protein
MRTLRSALCADCCRGGLMRTVRSDHLQDEVEEALAVLHASERLRHANGDGGERSHLITHLRWAEIATSSAVPITISVGAASGLAALLLAWWAEPSPAPAEASVSKVQQEASTLKQSKGLQEPASGLTVKTVEVNERGPSPGASSVEIASLGPQAWPPAPGLPVPLPTVRGNEQSSSPPWPVASRSQVDTSADKAGGVRRSEDELPPPAEGRQKLSTAEASVLGKRAEAMLAGGDISGARLLLRLLADNRDARATYLLARTFDPSFLEQTHTIGIHGDPAQARHWYEVARGLGSSEAAQSLQATPVQTVGRR